MPLLNAKALVYRYMNQTRPPHADSRNVSLGKSDFTVHGGGFSSPIVPQEGRDLALIEIDVEAVHSWTRASGKHLHQVLDLYPHH